MSGCSWCRGNADGAGSVLQLSPRRTCRKARILQNMFLQFEEQATSPINKRDSIKLVAMAKLITLPACTLHERTHATHQLYIPEQRYRAHFCA